MLTSRPRRAYGAVRASKKVDYVLVGTVQRISKGSKWRQEALVMQLSICERAH